MRKLYILVILLIAATSVQAQVRGTKDVVSISGRYALPQEYKEVYEGTAFEWGMMNALTAGLNHPNSAEQQ